MKLKNKEIPLFPIENSETIESVGYDAEGSRGTLVLKFEDKKTVYHFDNVPQHVITRLKSAPSPGRFYNENIRGRYTAKIIKKA